MFPVKFLLLLRPLVLKIKRFFNFPLFMSYVSFLGSVDLVFLADILLFVVSISTLHPCLGYFHLLLYCNLWAHFVFVLSASPCPAYSDKLLGDTPSGLGGIIFWVNSHTNIRGTVVFRQFRRGPQFYRRDIHLQNIQLSCLISSRLGVGIWLDSRHVVLQEPGDRSTLFAFIPSISIVTVFD